MKMRFCWALVGVWLMLHAAGAAQIATTTVSDTVYHADGSPAQGSLLISWPQFTTMSGAAVAAGSTTVTLSSMGGLSVTLTPNAGSNPIGSYYTVLYHLDDGTVSRENWVVPVSSAPVHLTTVRSTVMPLSVAMQTVSKAYVDTAIATISGLTAAHLQSLLESAPFYVTASGCEDADGDGTEGFLFETSGADGTHDMQRIFHDGWKRRCLRLRLGRRSVGDRVFFEQCFWERLSSRAASAQGAGSMRRGERSRASRTARPLRMLWPLASWARRRLRTREHQAGRYVR